MPNNKQFILRLGSNAEKQYIYKTGALFDAILTRANYFESSKGLASSLFIKLNILKKQSVFIIDPCTYVYALDPKQSLSIKSWMKCKKEDAIRKVTENLRLEEKEDPGEYIREITNPQSKDKGKLEINTIKRSYRKLADIFFNTELANIIGKRAIVPDDFKDANILNDFVSKVIEYQRTILLKQYDKEKYSDFRHGVKEPKLILSPYFSINSDSWLELMINLWTSFELQYENENAGLVVVIDKEFFTRKAQNIAEELLKLNTNNIFIWVANYKDHEVNRDQLNSFVDFIITLSQVGKSVFDLYSGGFTTYLIPYGLQGVTNGPGYGLDKDIEPVQGGTVSARYYIPSRHTRQPVFESYTLIVNNQIDQSKNSFHQRICNCPICQVAIKSQASDMLEYYGSLGDVRYDITGNPHRYPKPESIERCNFHFILSRLIEFQWAKNASMDDVINKLDEEIALWSKSNNHLIKWRDTLAYHRNKIKTTK
jgi:hypothetical protein